MINPAHTWISEAYTGGYLRAAFIDCQHGEYKCLDDKTPFTLARELAFELRKKNLPIVHFMLDETDRKCLKPFQYKDKNDTLIPNKKTDFIVAVPDPNEWVYPKNEFNGFENPYSEAILSTGDPLGRSTLICGGVTARACLMETALGSFDKASNPEKHRVVIALSTTNVYPQYHKEYMTSILAKADSSIRDNISFAVNFEIVNALNASRPSQSSPPRPYRA